jgi:hypothetical protein
MDRLDETLGTATPLLERVDEVLSTTGAPAEHAVWSELRRVRLLPGDAARAVAALDAGTLTGAVPELREDARACAEAAADLPLPDTWTGEAAEAYDDLRRRTAGELSGGVESLEERLEATADLAQALADWMTRTRADLAGALAETITSREALTLAGPVTAPPTPTQALAAAEVAAHVLHSVAESYADAADLLHGSMSLTEEIPM